MKSNSQSRKWNLTINNPQQCGLHHDVVAQTLALFSPTYYCLGDEISPSGTPHTHVFFYCPSPVRFGTVKKRFPTAHIEKAMGNCKQNRDYIQKGDKWAGTDKADTVVEGTFEEWGELPTERAEKAPAMARVVDNVRDGMTTAEIVTDNPGMAFKIRDIDTLRQTLLAERYTVENRDIEVVYLWGATGSGKTRYIYGQHDPRDICRITNYREGKGVVFDAYHGQDVLVFEEFNSQIPVEDMLNFLDVYPLYLPARYSDRVACYTKVYITSNLPLEAQYKAVQWNCYETWRAFLRRIHKEMEYKQDGTVWEAVRDEGGVFN